MKGIAPLIIVGVLIVIAILFFGFPASIIGSTEIGYIDENWHVSSTKSFNVGSTRIVKLSYVNANAMQSYIGKPYESHLMLNVQGRSYLINDLDIDTGGVYANLADLGNIYYVNGESFPAGSGGDVLATVSGDIDFPAVYVTTTTTIPSYYPTTTQRYTTTTLSYGTTTTTYIVNPPETNSCQWYDLTCQIGKFLQAIGRLFVT